MSGFLNLRLKRVSIITAIAANDKSIKARAKETGWLLNRVVQMALVRVSYRMS